MLAALLLKTAQEVEQPFRIVSQPDVIRFHAPGVFRTTAYLENLSDKPLTFVNLTSDFKVPSFLHVRVFKMGHCQLAPILTQSVVRTPEQLFTTTVPPKCRLKLFIEFNWSKDVFPKFFRDYADPGHYGVMLGYYPDEVKQKLEIMSRNDSSGRARTVIEEVTRAPITPDYADGRHGIEVILH